MSDLIEAAVCRLAAEIRSTITHDCKKLEIEEAYYPGERPVSVFVEFGPLLNIIGIDSAVADISGIVSELFEGVDDLASLTDEEIEAEARKIISDTVDCSYEYELGTRNFCGYGPYSIILPVARATKPTCASVDGPKTNSEASRLRSEFAACKAAVAELILENKRLKAQSFEATREWA